MSREVVLGNGSRQNLDTGEVTPSGVMRIGRYTCSLGDRFRNLDLLEGIPDLIAGEVIKSDSGVVYLRAETVCAEPCKVRLHHLLKSEGYDARIEVVCNGRELKGGVLYDLDYLVRGLKGYKV